MNKKSLKDLKEKNTNKVLEKILKEKQISRIEIAEKTDLSPSTVSMAVAALLEMGIVEEFSSGESTGGRKPILLCMNAGFGCVITIEVRWDKIAAHVYDMQSRLLGSDILAPDRMCGKKLSDTIIDFINRVKDGKTGYPRRVIGAGILCQDDIPDYDLTVEYSTGISTDIIRLETAVAGSCSIAVKKDLINRYSLDYYLKAVDKEYTDYAYVDIGERITTSFVLNRELVHNAYNSAFDISSAVLEDGTDTSCVEKLCGKLIQVLKNAMLFFPVKDIFIGGQAVNIDEIVLGVADEFQYNPAVRKVISSDKSMESAFAQQILTENYKAILIL